MTGPPGPRTSRPVARMRPRGRFGVSLSRLLSAAYSTLYGPWFRPNPQYVPRDPVLDMGTFVNSSVEESGVHPLVRYAASERQASRRRPGANLVRTLAGLHEVLADLDLGRLQAAVSRLGHASSSPGSRFSIQMLFAFPGSTSSLGLRFAARCLYRPICCWLRARR